MTWQKKREAVISYPLPTTEITSIFRSDGSAGTIGSRRALFIPRSENVPTTHRVRSETGDRRQEKTKSGGVRDGCFLLRARRQGLVGVAVSGHGASSASYADRLALPSGLALSSLAGLSLSSAPSPRFLQQRQWSHQLRRRPLGQGIANAVGLALAERHLAARFNTPDDEIVDHYTWKASQMKLALFLGTGVWEKLISFYDDNHISIDGDTEIAFTEDVSALIGAAMFLKVLLLKLSGMPSLQYTRRCIRSNRMNEYKESVFPAAVTARVSIEAGVTLGWGKYVGSKGKAIGIDRFGASVPAGRIYKEFGITAECIIAAAKSL
ncbi:hypothetical protein GW17_00060394 [Ensete ventricosum]|nr:hypothetical protein GW17_00060394 [Ensete ventricosum]